MRKIEIPVSRETNETVAVDMDALSPEMIDALVVFALQSRISNAFASMAEDKYPSKDDAIEAWTNEAHRHVAEAEDGTMRFGGGGGGKRTDALELECRAIFVTAATKKGTKLADAKKASVKWRSHVSDDVAAKITEKAAANVAARGDFEIEL